MSIHENKLFEIWFFFWVWGYPGAPHFFNPIQTHNWAKYQKYWVNFNNTPRGTFSKKMSKLFLLGFFKFFFFFRDTPLFNLPFSPVYGSLLARTIVYISSSAEPRVVVMSSFFNIGGGSSKTFIQKTFPPPLEVSITRPSRPIRCDVWIVERMRYRPTDRPTNGHGQL